MSCTNLEIIVPNNENTQKKNNWISKLFTKKKYKLVLYSYSKDDLEDWKEAIEGDTHNQSAIKMIREVENEIPYTEKYSLSNGMPAIENQSLPYESCPSSYAKQSSNANLLQSFENVPQLYSCENKSMESLNAENYVDNYAEIESIYSMFDSSCKDTEDNYEQNEKDHNPYEQSSLKSRFENCFACKGLCVNPLKLEGDFPIHSECFVCLKCHELPIDYVIVSDNSVVSPSSSLSRLSTDSNIFILCSECYQKYYSPKCSICKQSIISGSLERMGKLFHANCYFSND